MKRLLEWGEWVERQLLKGDVDVVLLSVGDEGSGKSTFGIQICKAVDKNFDASHICFELDDFIRKLKELPRGSAVLLDESGDHLMSREAMGGRRISTLKELMKCRALNKFIVLNISYLPLMEKYVRSFRARVMSRTITKVDLKNDVIRRGLVQIFSRKAMKKIKVMQDGSIRYPRPTLVDNFHNLAGDKLWDEYKEKKMAYVLNIELKKQKKDEAQRYISVDEELPIPEFLKRVMQKDGVTKRQAYNTKMKLLETANISQIQRGKVKLVKLMKPLYNY
jgi:hypothetical protein